MDSAATELNEKNELTFREAILNAEVSRLNGEPTFSLTEIRGKLKEKYSK